MLRVAAHFLLVLFLTVLTQVGGIAWLIALGFRRRVLIFVVLYTALSVSAVFVAPLFGRVPLPCTETGPLQVQSMMYCAMNRRYVTPQLADVLQDLASEMNSIHPGTVTQVLDANFPYLTGFPLLPHLSHDDGDKADVAFYYASNTGYERAHTRSPFGYFAFEDGPTACPKVWPTLRWDMPWVQGLWRDLHLEPARMKTALHWLASDARVGKVLLEPHLKDRFGISSEKIRFQGCHAARHDDHFHIQL